ncbi:hypothetical protein V8C37DRAFT_399177 [Trichoderma ceciliae]
MNAQIHQPVTAHLPQEAQYPGTSDAKPPELPKAQDSRIEPNPASDNGSPSHHPTWWQRFYTAFNLPVGAASTIASSPSPEPLKDTNDSINHPATYARVENFSLKLDNQTDRESLEPRAEEQDETSSMMCNLNASSDSVQSIRTDVATVHSDDFEMAPQSNHQP